MTKGKKEAPITKFNRERNPEDRPLTEKQKLFVEEFCTTLKGSEAAIKAGYSPNGVSKTQNALRNSPHVKKAIAERMKKASDNTSITPEWVLRKIKATVDKAEQADKYNDMLRGLELLGRNLSLFVDRTEITGRDGEAIEYQRIEEDAAAFTSSVISLASRAGKIKAVGGNES